MEIIPLSLTQVEWRVFVNTCQDVLGYSPTRGLDADGMDIKDPAAYLGCLDLDNNPNKSLRNPGPAFRHYSVSFIGTLDEDCLLQLLNTDLKITSKKGKRDYVVIMSASMDVWYQTILYACQVDRDYNLRAMMNIVVAFFERAGFRAIFASYSKHQLHDNTFVLRS